MGAVEMTEDMTVLAIFTEVRGFTKWFEATEEFINMDLFATGYVGILRRNFKSPEFQIKPLGDGAMILSSVPDRPTPRELTRLLGRTLTTIAHAEREFKKHCIEFSQRVGHSANLSLGWGIVR
ncbi:MAG TPA: hypothetical protein VNP92_02470, partial [Actinophytocola sp.]|nr:hypothetical protein [Actinophytocola sp.]